MTTRRTQHLRSVYFVYGILITAMTFFLLYGRPSPLDEKLTLVEMVCLLPGVILFWPTLFLTGGRYTSIFPFSVHSTLLGTLNIFACLAVPLATRAITRWWQERKTSLTQERTWLDIFKRPITMAVLGAGMFLVALNGAIHIWHGTDGPTDFANMVLGLFAAVGFVFLAHYLWRHGASIQFTSKALPAWTHWAVPLAALIGGVVGGRLAYGEARIVGWSTTAGGALAVAVTGITVLLVLIAFRLVQRQMK